MSVYLIVLCGFGLLFGLSGWDGGQIETRDREELMRLHELQWKLAVVASTNAPANTK